MHLMQANTLRGRWEGVDKKGWDRSFIGIHIYTFVIQIRLGTNYQKLLPKTKTESEQNSPVLWIRIWWI